MNFLVKNCYQDILFEVLVPIILKHFKTIWISAIHVLEKDSFSLKANFNQICS